MRKLSTEGFWLLAFGSWLLALGFWLLAFGSWLLALGFWLLAFGFWLLALGFWLLAFGSWLNPQRQNLLPRIQGTPEQVYSNGREFQPWALQPLYLLVISHWGFMVNFEE